MACLIGSCCDCSDEGDTSSCSDEDEEEREREGGGLTVETTTREAWSMCAVEEGQLSSSTSRQQSPDKLSPKSVRAMTERLSPLRQSLHMPCATLDLPEGDSSAAGPGGGEEEGAGSPIITSALRRHRSREWARRVNSPVREARSRTFNMPPELIVTQAQVYEACLEVTEKITVVKEAVTESISLPCISKRPPSARPHTGDPQGERQRSGSWQQMRSIPVYRAYYESHRVLVQRQVVEDRMTPGSPSHGVAQGGQMWGLQAPPRPKPKLQRQKSRHQPRPKREEESRKEQEPVPPPAPEPRTKKGKLRSKFKKSSLVSMVVSHTKQSGEQAKPEGSPVKATNNKSSSLPKNLSPTKRRNKKLAARVQSTDF